MIKSDTEVQCSGRVSERNSYTPYGAFILVLSVCHFNFIHVMVSNICLKDKFSKLASQKRSYSLYIFVETAKGDF